MMQRLSLSGTASTFRRARQCGGASRVVLARAKKDEEAAKKALRDMFEGKKDILEPYDRAPPPPGGGGGGWGGWFSNFNWGDWFDGFKAWWAGLAKPLATILVMVGVVVAFNCSGFVVSLVRAFFRLDGPRTLKTIPVSRSDQEKMDIAAGKISESEADLIAKYGDGTDDVYNDDEK